MYTNKEKKLFHCFLWQTGAQPSLGEQGPIMCNTCLGGHMFLSFCFFPLALCTEHEGLEIPLVPLDRDHLSQLCLLSTSHAPSTSLSVEVQTVERVLAFCVSPAQQ